MNLTRKNGFTLIEMLLYVGISAFLLISLSLFLSNNLNSRVKNQSILEVENQGRQIMYVITQEIRQSQEIISPNTSETGNELSLISKNDEQILFTLSGNTLEMIIDGGDPINLNNELVAISDLSFLNLTREGTPGIIQINFTLSRFSISEKNEYNYSKEFTTSESLYVSNNQ